MYVLVHGKNWSEIARILGNGRTGGAVKNRYNTKLRTEVEEEIRIGADELIVSSESESETRAPAFSSALGASRSQGRPRRVLEGHKRTTGSGDEIDAEYSDVDQDSPARIETSSRKPIIVDIPNGIPTPSSPPSMELLRILDPKTGLPKRKRGRPSKQSLLERAQQIQASGARLLAATAAIDPETSGIRRDDHFIVECSSKVSYSSDKARRSEIASRVPEQSIPTISSILATCAGPNSLRSTDLTSQSNVRKSINEHSFVNRSQPSSNGWSGNLVQPKPVKPAAVSAPSRDVPMPNAPPSRSLSGMFGSNGGQFSSPDRPPSASCSGMHSSRYPCEAGMRSQSYPYTDHRYGKADRYAFESDVRSRMFSGLEHLVANSTTLFQPQRPHSGSFRNNNKQPSSHHRATIDWPSFSNDLSRTSVGTSTIPSTPSPHRSVPRSMISNVPAPMSVDSSDFPDMNHPLFKAISLLEGNRAFETDSTVPTNGYSSANQRASSQRKDVSGPSLTIRSFSNVIIERSGSPVKGPSKVPSSIEPSPTSLSSPIISRNSSLSSVASTPSRTPETPGSTATSFVTAEPSGRQSVSSGSRNPMDLCNILCIGQ